MLEGTGTHADLVYNRMSQKNVGMPMKSEWNSSSHLIVEEVFNPHTPGFLGHSRAQLAIQVQDTRGLSYPGTYTKW